MRFFYLVSPATWLKIAIASLLLASVSLWFLAGYRINISRVAQPQASIPAALASAGNGANHAANRSASSDINASATGTPAPPLPAAVAGPPGMTQSHAIAPEGILDQYAEFAAIGEIDDSKLKPDFVLPDPVAPPSLLDPNWNGNPP